MSRTEKVIHRQKQSGFFWPTLYIIEVPHVKTAWILGQHAFEKKICKLEFRFVVTEFGFSRFADIGGFILFRPFALMSRFYCAPPFQSAIYANAILSIRPSLYHSHSILCRNC